MRQVYIRTGDPEPIDMLDAHERANDKRRRKWKWISGAQRTRSGKPGSRRHQQWLNESFLSDTAQLEVTDFTVVPNVKSLFTELFEQEHKLKQWEQFVESTEEEQNEILVSVSISVRNGEEFKQPSTLTSSQSFQKIDKRIRKVLQKHFESEFLCNLDQEIANWVKVEDYNTLRYSFEDSFKRLMCHGVCQFYSLKSISKPIMPNKKIVEIKKPNNFRPPETTLLQHLKVSL